MQELDIHHQLQWLLAADPHTPLQQALQPHLFRLPLATQHQAAVAAAACLSGSGCDSQASLMLLQLLCAHELAIGSTRGSSSGHTAVGQTAALALQQHQHLLPISSQLGLLQLPGQAPLPDWLAHAGSTQHCFAWLQPPPTATAPTSTGHGSGGVNGAAAAAPQPDGGTTAAAGAAAACVVAGIGGGCQGRDRGAGAGSTVAGHPPQLEQQQQQQQQHSQGVAAVNDDLHIHMAKRPRLDAAPAPQQPDATDHGAGTGAGALPSGAGNTFAAGAAAAAAAGDGRAAGQRRLQEALLQLEVLSASGNTGCLDAGLMSQLLSAAAAAAGAARGTTDSGIASLTSQQQEQLQQHLQLLPPDALQALVHATCSSNRDDGSSSSSSSGGGGNQLSGEALGYLLHVAVLPRLLGLAAAASQSLLACLVELGSSSSAAPVLVQAVLAPVMISRQLLPVQAQLLLKLQKEVPALQASVLDLLLQAALGGSGQCCWQEPHASLLKGLIDSCPSVVAQQLSAVLQALGAAVKQPGTAKSTVFGQLLMSMLKSYAGVLSQQQVEQLQNVVVGTSTFLTKALSSKLQQLLL